MTNKQIYCQLRASARIIWILENQQFYWQHIQFGNAEATGRPALGGGGEGGGGVKVHGCQGKQGHNLEKTLGLGAAWFLCYNCKCILDRKQWQKRAKERRPAQAALLISGRASELLKWAESQAAPGGNGNVSLCYETISGICTARLQTFSEAVAWLKSRLLFNA